MKRLLCLAAAVAVWANAAIPVPPIPRAITPPQLVGLKLWVIYPPEDLSPDLVFRIYHTTNITTPNWVVITNLLGGKTNCIVWMYPAKHYFTGSAYSVYWGEDSGMATVTNTPPGPRSDFTVGVGRP